MMLHATIHWPDVANLTLVGQLSLSKKFPQQSKRYDFIQSPIFLNVIKKFELS
jgi:hypothetical protein